MAVLLVRAGIDQAFGGWNAPYDPDSGDYVYVPIPESLSATVQAAYRSTFMDIMPALQAFCRRRHCELDSLGVPEALSDRVMHLDPDFACQTYGDVGSRRGRRLAHLETGDLLLFYAGFRPLRPCGQRLVYALFGQLTVQTVVRAGELPTAQHGLNAHTRYSEPPADDIVIIGKAAGSGRFQCALPIGEWREGAYRVTHSLLEAWGGLSVRNGYIQRNAAPPHMLQPERFRAWLAEQQVSLLADNG